MKNLLYVSIVHSQADMGSFSTELSAEGEKRYGVDMWTEHVKHVNESWDKIRHEVFKRVEGISMDRIKIYQDGLPVIDDIGLKIIRDAAVNSKNYQIIEALLDRGAVLKQAEDKYLLLKEYDHLSCITSASSPEKKMKEYLLYQDIADELLDDRDIFIAKQINGTLNKGDMGIAFFGAAHRIIDKLDKDINISYLQQFNDEISKML